jgi:hypothetical protein
LSLLLFLFVGFSITNTIVFLHAFHWFRIGISGLTDDSFGRIVRNPRGFGLKGFRQKYLGRLVRCHSCFGFWVGVSLSFFFGSFINRYMVLSFPSDVIADGFLLSGFNFVAWLVLKNMGAERL